MTAKRSRFRLGLGLVAAVAATGGGLAWLAGPLPDRAPATVGGPPTMRLISQDQYRNSLTSLFGPDLKIASRLPTLQRRDGLVALGAGSATMTPGDLDQFDRAAHAIAAQIVDERRRPVLVGCTPAAPDALDDACVGQFFDRIGSRLYRRPLTDAELQRQVAAAAAATRHTGDFHAGLAESLAGMLVSPKFLYIAESTEPVPGSPGRWRLDGFSKAGRLSFFLWNGAPDDALLAAAANGEIHSPEGFRRQVDRMLASPRLKDGVRHFFTDMLALRDLEHLSKDAQIYSSYTGGIAALAKEQTLRMIVDHLVDRQGDYRDLFTSRRTFMTGPLGALYRAPVADPAGWSEHEFPAEGPRAGLLTGIAFLSAHAHPGRSSPTRRGRALRELIMCQTVPDPPPNVNFDLFEDPDRKIDTARDRLHAHNADPVCAGCHKLTDPIGLALENFDGSGQYRTREGETSIDTSGVLDGQTFVDAAGLGLAVRENPATVSCLVSKLFANAVGRKTASADNELLSYLAGKFAAHGYRYVDLLREIAESDAFLAVPAAAPSNSPEAGKP